MKRASNGVQVSKDAAKLKLQTGGSMHACTVHSSAHPTNCTKALESGISSHTDAGFGTITRASIVAVELVPARGGWGRGGKGCWTSRCASRMSRSNGGVPSRRKC